MSFPNTKPRGVEQFVLPARRAKAGTKGEFFWQTPVQPISQHIFLTEILQGLSLGEFQTLADRT